MKKALKILLLINFIGSLHAEAASISGPTTVTPYCPVTYNVVGCSGTVYWSSSPASMEVLSGGNGNSWITVRYLNTGSYGIIVYGGCNASLNVSVSGTIPIISGPAVACYDSFSTFTAPAGSYAQVWSVNVAVQSQVASGSTYTIRWLAGSPPPNAIVSLTTNTGSCSGLSLKKTITIESNAGTITGPISSTDCSDYSISGTSPNWIVNGGTFVQGSNPMRINWNPATTQGTISVSYTSTAGCIKSAAPIRSNGAT